MDSIITFASQFAGFSLPLFSIGAVMFGEVAILPFAFLAGQGAFPLSMVILGSFMGMLASDAFWFFIPRTTWGQNLQAHGRANYAQYRQLEQRIERFSRGSDILILLLSKAMVGTRLLTVLYLSVRQLTFRRFIVLAAIANACWATLVALIGWFAGVGYYSLGSATNNLAVASFYITSVIIVVYVAVWLLRRVILKN